MRLVFGIKFAEEAKRELSPGRRLFFSYWEVGLFLHRLLLAVVTLLLSSPYIFFRPARRGVRCVVGVAEAKCVILRALWAVVHEACVRDQIC